MAIGDVSISKGPTSWCYEGYRYHKMVAGMCSRYQLRSATLGLIVFTEQWGTVPHPPLYHTRLSSLSSFFSTLRASFFGWGRSCNKTTGSTWGSTVWRAADDEVCLEEQHWGPCSLELSTGGGDWSWNARVWRYVCSRPGLWGVGQIREWACY